MQADVIDGVELEIWWSRLVAIADEAATALLRTAFSTIIRESNDYAVVLMDATGRNIAECQAGIPAFSAVLGVLTPALLERFPAETWRPGDVVITNHPWLATGHLPDITMVVPIFHRDRLVGFSGTAAHAPDIGGSYAMGVTDLMAEGVLIPPIHLERHGRRNEEVLTMLLSNVRMPTQVLGDLEAHRAANEVCRRRAVELLSDSGLRDFETLAAAVQGKAETAMRRAVERVPDGVYRSAIDADGVDEHPTHIACEVTVAGDRLTVDYTGTSAQVSYPTNCTLNYATAYTRYPLKVLLDPFTRRNHGSYRPITVTAPPGSIVNANFPAPVMARHLTGHLLSCAVFQALAEVIPEQVIADSGGSPALRVRFFGRKADGGPFVLHFFASAGMGASAQGDGLSTTAFPTNSGAGSIEALEASAPVLFGRKEYRIDSGGPGAQRGGLGQDIVVENVTDQTMRVVLLGDRERHPPQGLLGGGSGYGATAVRGDGVVVPLKSDSSLPAGEHVTISFAGGGGYGPPQQRSRDAVDADVSQGFVSAEAALHHYGVDLAVVS